MSTTVTIRVDTKEKQAWADYARDVQKSLSDAVRQTMNEKIGSRPLNNVDLDELWSAADALELDTKGVKWSREDMRRDLGE
ncbi:MAG: DUF6290 family protein [Coriobacteriia bacterium]|nr:DUF6290 family protein [Coriobacteriia bacterium]